MQNERLIMQLCEQNQLLMQQIVDLKKELQETKLLAMASSPLLPEEERKNAFLTYNEIQQSKERVSEFSRQFK